MKKIATVLQLIFCSSLLLVAYAQTAPGASETAKADKPAGFVTRSGANLVLEGKTFRFAGTNNYYLMYKSREMVDAVLEKAAANNFDVVRTWGFLDIGNPDGSSDQKPADGVYFQFWDGTEPAYNDGPDGLERMDYIVAKAGELGVKLVIPLTNNWSAFGGIDQYVRWAGGEYHDDFYRDPQIRSWYKDWISHMLNRVNTVTGVAYKDDPTIMTWELGNEPRCVGSGAYPRSPDCDTGLLTDWAAEMSAHIKGIDKNHLVSVGDEGFYCKDPDNEDWTVNCGEGVDTVAFAKLPTIDIMSFHLYPDHWDKDAAWGGNWIASHIKAARELEKPVMLGEFGWQDKATRNPVFKTWTDVAREQKIDGMLYWILSDVQEDGSLYPDFDGFTVYCPSPVCTTLSNFSLALNGTQSFAPVADNDEAKTKFGTSATLKPLANDVTYGVPLVPGTLDLSAAAGRQTSSSVPGKGVFKVQGGALSFTPVKGFAGEASAPYTVADGNKQVSNPATVSVTVLPKSTGVRKIFGFEAGTDSWAPANWEAVGGTVSQSSNFATEGENGLEITSTGGGWFGLDFDEPLDLANKVGLKYDLEGSSVPMIALKVGSEDTWCQYSAGEAAEDTTTVSVAWDDFGCDFDAGDVRGMYLYLNGGETSYIDNVRAE